MRKRLVAGLAVFVLFFAAASSLLFSRPCAVTRAGFDPIEVGMTIAEGEGVMDCPPGDCTTVREPSRARN